MSKTPGSSKKTTTPIKEIIIPIQLEAKVELQRMNFQIKAAETPTPNIDAEISLLSDDGSGRSSPVFNSQQSDRTIELDTSQKPHPISATYVPEKIIIILDRSLDDNFTFFEQKSNKKYNPLNMLQRVVQIFVLNKHALNADHEYALIILNENSASWTHDFTKSPQDIIASLSSIKSCKPEDIFNINSVFDLIYENVAFPDVNDAATPFVVRAVLLYGRSYSIPVLNETPEITSLLKSPIFTFDVIMTHEPPDSDNHCNQIFEKLQSIDQKGASYSFSVSRNSRDLHTAMGKLLAHCLQRPLQSDLNCDIMQFTTA